MTDTTTEQPTEAGELERFSAAIEKVKDTSVALDDILRALQTPQPLHSELRSQPPARKTLNDEERSALARVHEVFGSVQPEKRRVLAPAEVEALAEERATLDTVKKMAEKRIDAIKQTVHVHLDIEAEAQGIPEGIPRHSEHHFLILAGEAKAPGTGRRFVRQVSERGPRLDADALKALADAGEIDHEDYLAMTEQVRVVNEAKVTLHLRKKPGLIKAIAKATRAGGKTAAMYLRKL